MFSRIFKTDPALILYFRAQSEKRSLAKADPALFTARNRRNQEGAIEQKQTCNN